MNAAKTEAGGSLELCAWILKQTELKICCHMDFIEVTKKIRSCEIPKTVY